MRRLLLISLSLFVAGCGSDRGPTRPTGPIGPTTPPSGSAPPLTIAPISPLVPTYSRAEWRHWIDSDDDCQDTRAEVLIEESLAPVLFRLAQTCVADSGRWDDPYTGQTIFVAGELDIDHLVPLGNAHRSGAWLWSPDQKRLYANDLTFPLQLVAVRASANRSKGDRGPEAWRPENRAFWCEYAEAWIHIKRTWNLTATEAEWGALEEMRGTCL